MNVRQAYDLWNCIVLLCLLSYFVFIFVGFDNMFRQVFLSMGIGGAIAHLLFKLIEDR